MLIGNFFLGGGVFVSCADKFISKLDRLVGSFHPGSLRVYSLSVVFIYSF